MNRNTQPNNNIYSPANDSLSQSYRIAALERFCGIRGVVSPVFDRARDLQYDFMEVKTGVLIKFFTTLDLEEIQRYEEHRPEDALVIIELEDAAEFQCTDCNSLHTERMPADLLAAVDILNPLLYWDHKLWSEDEDQYSWNVMLPYERAKVFDALRSMDFE